jgi:hypothetical protein
MDYDGDFQASRPLALPTAYVVSSFKRPQRGTEEEIRI